MNILSLRRKNFALPFLGVLAVVYAFFLLEHLRQLPRARLLAALYDRVAAVFYFPLLSLFHNTVLTVSFWCVVIFTLCLQQLIPAKPAQRTFSIGFAQDCVWFFYERVLSSLVVVAYADYLIRFYDGHFSGLTIAALNQTPAWVRFLFALLLSDFLYWAQHYINHKVPLLWRFHALHHSQRELNFFTDFRYHVLEYIVRQTFLVVPFLILKIGPPMIVGFVIFHTWYSRFYHGNIRTNMGPLKYILVTPQSHRVHHSLDPRHRDTNYGAFFSTWDFLLGTQWRKYDVYPETGIDDEAFPQEQNIGLKRMLLTPIQQMLYPLLDTGRRRPASGVKQIDLPGEKSNAPI